MVESKVCAYIDILGYKGFVNKDLNGASVIYTLTLT